MSLEYSHTLEPFEQAQKMSMWYQNYVCGLADTVGYISDITSTRLTLLFGEGLTIEEGMAAARDAVTQLADNPADQHNFNLFMCGYPDKDLFDFGVGDIRASLIRINRDVRSNTNNETHSEHVATPLSAGKPTVKQLEMHSIHRQKFARLGMPAMRRTVTHSGGAVTSLDELREDGEAKAHWQDLALCREVDPEIFFPDKGGSTKEAKKICERCEVTSECLQDALSDDDRFGIRGGKSERERHRMKRGRVAVSEITQPTDERLDPALLVQEQPHLRINQLFTILCQDTERDDDFEEAIEYDEQLREKLIDVVMNKLYRNGVKNPNIDRLERLTRYFGIKSSDGKDSEWTIKYYDTLEKDLRLFNEIIAKIHRDYEAINAISGSNQSSSILDVCRLHIETDQLGA